jgi:hypothetical protein
MKDLQDLKDLTIHDVQTIGEGSWFWVSSPTNETSLENENESPECRGSALASVGRVDMTLSGETYVSFSF